ncbi:MAG: serine hydrolase [Aquabacterium sp.]|nr:serine hydrolase [Aquabacterium sp.]
MTTPVLDLLHHQIAARHCPGALLLVERAGQVLARHALGRIHPDADAPLHAGVRFRIASLTKPVVTVAVLMQVDAGLLDLDTPVGEILPALRGLRLADGSLAVPGPTVRDLMRHTAGFAYPQEVPHAALRAAWTAAALAPGRAGVDGARLLAGLAALPLVNAPGAAFRYGYSTDVLGLVVEAIDGVPLATALQRRLFGPLGMRHTSFETGPGEPLATAFAADAAWHATVAPIGQRQAGAAWMDSGGGGLISTLDDYAAFARLLADGGVVGGPGGAAGGQRLLSERLFAALSRNQLADGVDGPAGYTGPGFGFGLGLAVRHDWGPSAMPCTAGELTWSGISGTALFVQPRERWFAVLMSANMASRMMARMALRRALAA